MFPIYAVPAGVVIGWLLGGRLANLERLPFRWAWLAIAGLAVQIVLFALPVGSPIGPFVPVLYVGSTLVVLAVVVRNVALPGLWLVALGAASNLVAIVANGGYMPADPGALALAGFESDSATLTNSVTATDAALRPLTDLYAVPAALPFSNVFSVGDALIGIGLAVTIALAMRRSPAATTPSGELGDPVRAGNSPD